MTGLDVHVARLTQALKVRTHVGFLGAGEISERSFVVDRQRAADKPTALGATAVLLCDHDGSDHQPRPASVGLRPTHPEGGLLASLVGVSVFTSAFLGTVETPSRLVRGKHFRDAAVPANHRNVSLALGLLGRCEESRTAPRATVTAGKKGALAIEGYPAHWTRQGLSSVEGCRFQLTHPRVSGRTTRRTKQQPRLGSLTPVGLYVDHLSAAVASCEHVTSLPPFGGTGTTGMVAAGNGRDALLFDLDGRNLDLARERIGMFLTEPESA